MQQPRMAEKFFKKKKPVKGFFKNASGYGISIFHPRGKDMKKSRGNAEIHSSSTNVNDLCKMPDLHSFSDKTTKIFTIFYLWTK